MAELAAHEPGAKLALPPGRYHITRRGQRDIAERDTDVKGGETTVLAAANMARVDLGRVVRKGDIRRSATGFALTAGWRTSEWGQEPSLYTGSGPTLLATLRHDRRRFSLETRLGVEREVVDAWGGAVQTVNQGMSLTAAALFPIDWRGVTLSFGAEVGLVLIRQKYTPNSLEPLYAPLPTTPGLTPPRWSDGWQFGPLAQLDFPLGQRAYLRFEAGFPYRYFSESFALLGPTLQYRRGAHLHIVAGAGMSF